MKDDISLETIGCDLGDKMSEVCRLCSDGSQDRATVRTTMQGMTVFFTRPRCHVVIEVGPHSRWVSELLQELGHQVTVANPRQVKLISGGTNKSDRRDCELLARLGRVDVELLAPISHRGRASQVDLAVAKGRDVLVATRTKLVNHVRGVLKSFGLQLPRCDAECFGRKTRELVPAELKAALDPIY
jgi:transposase